jgi:hypothetical protein
MNNRFKILLMAAMLLKFSESAAFCGFYVAQAGAQIFNNKSEVIIVRDGERQTITMLNDFKGDLKQFAMVIPVPTVLGRKDIRIMEQRLFTSFDQYSAPRMVEYYDQNPCEPRYDYEYSANDDAVKMTMAGAMVRKKDKDESGVTIEAQYTIDEYEILILSAKESSGLQDWLNANGYSVPDNAKEVLEPYIKDKMKFFAVKVNLTKAKSLNRDYLRPIQITFNTAKFMLPIRLGMANSSGEQDLVIYAFTRTGRVETANYRTVEMPSAKKVPTFVKNDFASFYKQTFDREYEREGKNAVFVEYAWNVSPNWGVKCDPCVGNPPIVADLISAGVNWIDPLQSYSGNVFFTRLHVRYSRSEFPEDLAFIETPNTETFQVRHIITHPAGGEFQCKDGMKYLTDLRQRRKLELQEMEALAGWNPEEYPFYVELGSGTKVALENQEQQEDENLIPLWMQGGAKPPSWMLPLLLLGGILLIQIRNRLKRKPVYT